MRYAQLPFFTREEMRQVHERLERLDNGCLVFHPVKHRPDTRNHHIRLRGRLWNVLRLMWSETFATTIDARNQLEMHDVGHIPECPNTGGTCGELICVEPSHLTLVDYKTRGAFAAERQKAYKEQTA